MRRFAFQHIGGLHQILHQLCHQLAGGGGVGLDDLFSTEEERAEARLEKVVNLSPAEISDFPNHPFKVRMDAAMQEMAESVKQYGVLVPTLVRPKPEGGYEMVAGHRRKKAADLAGLAEIPDFGITIVIASFFT